MARIRQRAWWIPALIAVACTVPSTSPEPDTDSPPAGDFATLVRVDDGDSFVALIDGTERTVRLIGINAPERGECLSEAASTRLQELLEGNELTLVGDVESVDRFDRLLRYVFAGDVFVNQTLAAEGLALARPFAPNTSMQEMLDSAETDARDRRLGLWNPEACGGVDAAIAISEVVADPPGPDLDGEYIELVNTGPELDLTGWSIRDETSQNRFEFPSETRLASEGRLRIYSGCGTDTATELYWCSSNPIWDNSGDTVFIVAPTGSIHASSTYGG